ncbi:efflux RND transporter periplasmic adaptor subunit [Niveispirillum sp.]|uniref:efflux RND transporter periplasmic adaptor subunit n=1 Tax=Niveispirillum sp. TaxID=1917217 RepID=UPI001B709852|nr:efflux RND transporter periplasmic adaptor subunit [Niveispirillum sp.]MBP7340001.1 efflux RND transporter periplasmic adaptor subunit [Niveispirillum sp.]
MRLPLQIATAVAIVAIGGGVWYMTGRGGDKPAGQQQAASRPVNVVAAHATRGDIAVTFDAVGTLRANEAVTLTAKTAGLVKSINFTEGQLLQAGTVLVELDDREVRANLAVAESARRNTAQLLDRARALLSRQNVSQARVDELSQQLAGNEAEVRVVQARLQDLSIRAPFTGYAGLRQVSPGALVRPADTITTLDDTRTVKLEFTVPEASLRNLRPGMEIAALSSVYPGQTFVGTVTAIDTRVDNVTRTVAAVARIDNADGHLRPGMFMTVQLTLDNRTNVVLVPEESLVPVGDRQFVFMVVSGKVERRPVTIGARSRGVVEVAEGLQGGELVITRGIQKVRDGVAVQVEIANGASAGGGSQSAARPNL